MSELTTVTPKIVNDIEFYVSASGKECGVSKNGLSRLCGVHRNALYTLLDLIDQYNPQDNKPVPKLLEPLINNIYLRTVKSEKGAHIISSYTAALIIQYYAYESKAANETAKISLSKFAARGIDSWIKEVTQFTEKGNDSALEKTLIEMMGRLDSISVLSERYYKLVRTTVEFYPGLNHINDQIVDSDDMSLESADLYTVKEWLDTKKLTITNTQFRSLCLLTSQTYKTLTGKEPKVKYRPYMRKDGTATTQKVGLAYKERDFHILEAAYLKLLARS